MQIVSASQGFLQIQLEFGRRRVFFFLRTFEAPLHELFNGHSVRHIYHKGPLEKLLWRGAYKFGKHLTQFEILHLFQQLLLSAGFPGGPSGQHLEEDYAQGPNIPLMAVLILHQTLNRHVGRWSHVLRQGSFALFCVNCKAKVSDLVKRSFEKNIGRFEIAVYHALPDELLAAGHHLLHDFNCVFLVQSAGGGQLGLEGAAFAELGD